MRMGCNKYNETCRTRNMCRVFSNATRIPWFLRVAISSHCQLTKTKWYQTWKPNCWCLSLFLFLVQPNYWGICCVELPKQKSFVQFVFHELCKLLSTISWTDELFLMIPSPTGISIMRIHLIWIPSRFVKPYHELVNCILILKNKQITLILSSLVVCAQLLFSSLQNTFYQFM